MNGMELQDIRNTKISTKKKEESYYHLEVWSDLHYSEKEIEILSILI